MRLSTLDFHDLDLDPVVQEAARRLDEARRRGQPMRQLTERWPQLDADTAEAIQRVGFALRQEAGETLTGWKMGLTSRAKMVQVGVHEPIRGRLGSATALPDGATLALSGFCHPRVEPEIAFVVGRDVEGNPSTAELLDAMALVVPALEVIDSRYENFRFTLADVVADNTSAARYVLGGPGLRPSELRRRGLQLEDLGVVFEVDGTVAHTASAAAILDGPQHALASLQRSLAEQGQGLRRGEVVLAGAATAAVPLQGKRYVRATVEALGSVSLRIASQ
ncbi:MAG: 4-oxalocrotonate decarboxylase [Pseudomonadota bacterium]|jgi:2-oxo-3-hexenedioate decarboxylase